MVMTKEEKDLLVKDLCGRLPYDLRVDIRFRVLGVGVEHRAKVVGFNFSDFGSYLSSGDVTEIKPYLLPMSSITDAQKEIYNTLAKDVALGTKAFADLYDWLNEHNFDYRGLIEKGLAIDATGLNIY